MGRSHFFYKLMTNYNITDYDDVWHLWNCVVFQRWILIDARRVLQQDVLVSVTANWMKNWCPLSLQLSRPIVFLLLEITTVAIRYLFSNRCLHVQKRASRYRCIKQTDRYRYRYRFSRVYNSWQCLLSDRVTTNFTNVTWFLRMQGTQFDLFLHT